jgi:hypothetical protein
VCAGVTMRQVRDAAHENRVHRCPDDLDSVQVNVWEVNVAEGGMGELERLAWTVGDGTAMVGLEKAVCRIGVGHKVRLTLQVHTRSCASHPPRPHHCISHVLTLRSHKSVLCGQSICMSLGRNWTSAVIALRPTVPSPDGGHIASQ